MGHMASVLGLSRSPWELRTLSSFRSGICMIDLLKLMVHFYTDWLIILQRTQLS